MFAVTSLILLVVGVIAAQPVNKSNATNATNSIWEGSPDECSQQSEGSACFKLKVLNLVDEILDKDIYKISDGISVVHNGNGVKRTSAARSSDTGFLDLLESYIKSHDLVVKTPSGFLQGATFKMSPRNLDDNELNMSVKLPLEDENSVAENRGRKSKLRKILVPILVFVLLKAMTLIPLAIGVLGLKAWNALQLSFISFLVSISLAIFQLCKKVAADSGSQIAAHIPFETSHYAAARNFITSPEQSHIVNKKADMNGHHLAYREYAESS